MPESLRFTGDWPPAQYLEQYPNWGKEGEENQDETTLKPSDEQSYIDDETAFTVGDATFADGRVCLAIIQVDYGDPQVIDVGLMGLAPTLGRQQRLGLGFMRQLRTRPLRRQPRRDRVPAVPQRPRQHRQRQRRMRGLRRRQVRCQRHRLQAVPGLLILRYPTQDKPKADMQE